MSLRYEDRELQIALVELQIDHESLATTYTGFVAMEFGAIIGLASIFYGLYGRSDVHFLIPAALIGLIWGMLVAIYYTLEQLRKRRKRLKRRIEELRKKYVW